MVFDEYKFRCSSLGNLMTALTKKELPVGAKTFLQELWKQETYDYDPDIRSKYLDKGNMVEGESMELYSSVTGQPCPKNKSYKANDYIHGTPDSVTDKIIEIKSSWSLSTFPMFAEKIPTMGYYYQCQGYMDLFEKDYCELAYCLVSTPEILVEDEIRRAIWAMGDIEISLEMEAKIRKEMNFDNIPEADRVKIFPIQKDEAVLEQLRERIELARDYMNQLNEKR